MFFSNIFFIKLEFIFFRAGSFNPTCKNDLKSNINNGGFAKLVCSIFSRKKVVLFKTSIKIVYARSSFTINHWHEKENGWYRPRGVMDF